MGCTCGKNTQQQLDHIKNEMQIRQEKIIVDWSNAHYHGGSFGNDFSIGTACLTNICIYFVSPSVKIEQPLKQIYEVIYDETYKKKKGDFATFKMEQNKEFVLSFIENKDKLKADCKSLIAEKKQSIVEIEVL